MTREAVREALKLGWHLSHAATAALGHTWDVADVMEVYDAVMAAVEQDEDPRKVVWERS